MVFHELRTKNGVPGSNASRIFCGLRPQMASRVSDHHRFIKHVLLGLLSKGENPAKPPITHLNQNGASGETTSLLDGFLGTLHLSQCVSNMYSWVYCRKGKTQQNPRLRT